MPPLPPLDSDGESGPPPLAQPWQQRDAEPATAGMTPNDATEPGSAPAVPSAAGAPPTGGAHEIIGGSHQAAQPGPAHRPKRTTPWGAIIATAAATALIVGGGTAWAVTSLMGAANPASSGIVAGDSAWTAVAANASNSVVAIQATGGSSESQGSGVVWDDQGHIVTNHHVIESAGRDGVTVLVGTRVYPASVVGSDAATDLAVIKIDNPPAELTPLGRADSEALQVGDDVAAIGNPLGLSGTVTTGIISAIDRPVATSGGANAQIATITNAIQTSAPLNPGNSGGALVNRAGELIGINSAIATLGGQSSGNIGIGFAIPVNLTEHIAGQLIEHGKVEHAWLGTTTSDGTATLGDIDVLGAQVQSVDPNGPASAAGMQTGDLIIAANGESISGSRHLVGTVRAFSVGEEVTFTVVRDGQEVDLTVTMGVSPNL